MIKAVPIYRALQRPHLLLGAERKLVLSAGALSAALVFAAMTILSIVIGIALWGISILVFRKMAKADPYMSEVYLRHIKYRRYYPASSTPWRRT